MREVLLVGVGGLLGSISRYLLSSWVLHWTHESRFPFSTLAVNVLGCLIAGILAGLIEHQHWMNMQVRLLLFTGMLGGFTTFSAFGFETIFLIRSGLFGLAILNVMCSVVLGLSAVWLGFMVSRMVWP